MKIYNAKEIFAMLYDRAISEDDCIEIVHPEEQNHYLFRNSYGDFDEDDLIGCLLFKEYKFRIVNQQRAKKKVFEDEKQEKIERLEKELSILRSGSNE